METTMKVSLEVKSSLDKLKIHHRETYNELLKRLVEGFDKDKESLVETIEIMGNPQLMRDIAEGISDYQKGNFVTLKQLKKENGL